MVNTKPDGGIRQNTANVEFHDDLGEKSVSLPLNFLTSIRSELKAVEELTEAGNRLEKFRQKPELTGADRVDLAKLARSTLTLTNRLDLDQGTKGDVREALLKVVELAEGKAVVSNLSTTNTSRDPNAAISDLAKQIKVACDKLVDKHGAARLVA